MGSSSKFEQMMTAITFAEAGEFETARGLMPVDRTAGATRLGWFERIFAAVALAEGGLHEDAMRLSRFEPVSVVSAADFLSTVGLKGVKVHYAVMAS